MNLDKPKLEPIRTCEEPKTDKVDRETPKYEPIRTCEEPKMDEVDRETPKYEPIRTCEEPKTDKVDRDTPKYEPIRTCEKPKTEKNERNKPKSRPVITFESSNTDKDGNDDIASKPDDTPKISKSDDKGKKIDGTSQKPKSGTSQKPKDKTKNKNEPKKIDTKKKPKHRIQRAKFDPKTQPKNKIKLRQMDIHKEPKHKIQHQQIKSGKPRNKIEHPKFDPNRGPINKIQPQQTKNKIERIPSSEPKNTAKPEVSQLSLEKIKGELKKFDWKIISEDWTVKVQLNGIKEISLNPYELPSKENPLYKHKEWLQTVYNHKIWNLNDNKLRKISGVSNSTIYSWRKKFNVPIKQPERQRLISDGKQKECGHCHKMKPIDEYGARISKQKKILFSRCKECRIDINQIYKYNNKVKIIQNAYNGKLKGKCQTCSADMKKLPALEFHHLDPKLKSGKVISMSRNWEETKRQVENEKATILCENCHTKQRSKYYNKHEKIIQGNNLKPLASNTQISHYVKNKLPNANYEVLRQVTRSIKKQIIIDHLYKGKCVGCGDVSTKKNLPALHFHHRNKNNPYKMSKTYVNLRNLENKEIIKKLKHDNCITLCGNCHRMEQATQFKNNYEKIVNPEHWDNIKKEYEMIENNIKNFKFGNLNYQYGYGEAWKKYLTHITKLLNEGKMVQTKTLAESVGVNTRNTRKNIQKLIAKGLISIAGEHNNRTIIITDKGKKETK